MDFPGIDKGCQHQLQLYRIQFVASHLWIQLHLSVHLYQQRKLGLIMSFSRPMPHSAVPLLYQRASRQNAHVKAMAHVQVQGQAQIQI